MNNREYWLVVFSNPSEKWFFVKVNGKDYISHIWNGKSLKKNLCNHQPDQRNWGYFHWWKPQDFTIENPGKNWDNTDFSIGKLGWHCNHQKLWFQQQKKKLGFIRLHPDFLGNMFVGFNHNKMRFKQQKWWFMRFHWPKSRFFIHELWEVDHPKCWVNNSDE